VSVTAVAPAEMRAWAPGTNGVHVYEEPWLVKVHWEYVGRKTAHSIRVPDLHLVVDDQDFWARPTDESELALAQFIGRLDAPTLEEIPAEYMPRSFVQESAPDRWEYRAKVDIQKTMLLIATGGISLLLPGNTPETELVERPAETPSQKKQRERRNQREQAAFEKAEREKLAAQRAAIDAVVARNRTTLAAHQEHLEARMKLVQAVISRSTPSCKRDEAGGLALAPGKSCDYVTHVSWSSRFGDETSVLKGELEALLPTGASRCTRKIAWSVPVPGATLKSWAPALKARFERGPVSLTLGAKGLVRGAEAGR
jgi:hypothetical protein